MANVSILASTTLFISREAVKLMSVFIDTFFSKSVFMLEIKLSDVLIYTINSSVISNWSISAVALSVAEAVNEAAPCMLKPPIADKEPVAVKEAEAPLVTLPDAEHAPVHFCSLRCRATSR